MRYAMRYEYKIMVNDTTLAITDTLIHAEHLLEVARSSYLATLFSQKDFFIKRAIKCLTTV